MSKDLKFYIPTVDEKKMDSIISWLDARGMRSKFIREQIFKGFEVLEKEAMDGKKIDTPAAPRIHQIVEIYSRKEKGYDISYELLRDLENNVLTEEDVMNFYMTMKCCIIEIEQTNVLHGLLKKHGSRIRSKRISNSPYIIGRIKEACMEEIESRKIKIELPKRQQTTFKDPNALDPEIWEEVENE